MPRTVVGAASRVAAVESSGLQFMASACCSLKGFLPCVLHHVRVCVLVNRNAESAKGQSTSQESNKCRSPLGLAAFRVCVVSIPPWAAAAKPGRLSVIEQPPPLERGTCLPQGLVCVVSHNWSRSVAFAPICSSWSKQQVTPFKLSGDLRFDDGLSSLSRGRAGCVHRSKVLSAHCIRRFGFRKAR